MKEGEMKRFLNGRRRDGYIYIYIYEEVSRL
jgi:hypothetical protein